MTKVQSKKGFTMISVGIMVIITIILLSAVAVSAVSSISNAKKINFSSDIVYIQDEVDNYYIKSGYTSYPTGVSVTVDLTSVSDAGKAQFVGETIASNKVILNEIDYTSLGIKRHVYGNNTNEFDKYVVSTVTGKVYYVAGIKASSKVYYTILPELNKEYRRKATVTSNGIIIDDVILELSTVKYTNQPITVKVKLPKEYTLGTLVTSNSVQVSSVVEVGNYEEINVNTLNLSCNYSINIPYTKNGTSKVVKYMVNKFDNTAPTIIGTTQISSKDPATEVTTAYISLSGVSDNLSGIKTLKYAEETVALEDAKAYFSNNGIDVIDNKIKIRKYPNYTVYIEDNAGNISVTNISIDVNILAEVE